MGHCIARLSSGALLDVQQRYLETIIPKVGKVVLVVQNIDKSLVGQLAKLLEYNSKTDRAIIQMETTYDMVTVGLDDISEYVE